LVAVLADLWDSVFVVDDGVVVSEDLVDLRVHEVVVGLDVVFGDEVRVGAHYFFDDAPVYVTDVVRGASVSAFGLAAAGGGGAAAAHSFLWFGFQIYIVVLLAWVY
jgi:hypothetical protein